jgi:hypothetical protein
MAGTLQALFYISLTFRKFRKDNAVGIRFP